MGQNCDEGIYVSKLLLKFPPLLIKVVVVQHLIFALSGVNSMQITNNMVDRSLGTSLEEIKSIHFIVIPSRSP